MKFVVPVMPKSLEEAKALDVSPFEGADVIEWRADALAKSAILEVAPVIFERFAGREVIFSLRTKAYGGQIELDSADYINLIKEVNTLYQPDYIDVEYYNYQDVFDQLLDYPNLILSYYNFERVPENIMAIYSELTALAPRMVKLAIMPQHQQEVLDLMNYTRGFKTLNPDQGYLTIAMGPLGQVTRIFGDLFGNSWTIVKVGDSLAPGQLSLYETQQILKILEKNR